MLCFNFNYSNDFWMPLILSAYTDALLWVYRKLYHDDQIGTGDLDIIEKSCQLNGKNKNGECFSMHSYRHNHYFKVNEKFQRKR